MNHGWEYRKLCDIAPAKSFDGDIEPYENKYWCLNLDKIESDTGRIIEYDYLESGDLHGSIYKFSTRNVLFSKLRPNLNKVVVPMHDGYCTTELVPLCPVKELNRMFLSYYLRNPRFVKVLVDKTGGAKMPRVKMNLFWNCEIPLPELEIQNQIVSELDKINELIEAKHSQLKDLDALAQSFFYETFGDPVENPKEWVIKKIEDVCILKSGDSSANHLNEGEIPYVKVGDMNLCENRHGIVTSSNFVDIGDKSNLIFPIGTTIFPKRGGAILTNKKRLTKVPICCDLNIMGAIPQDVDPMYLYYFFLLIDFAELVDGSTVPQINNKDIYPLKIPAPPISLQNQFASKIEAIEAQKKQVEASIADLETLLASRMDYWFND
jgi:putative type I restriction modification DNA specificity domain protein